MNARKSLLLVVIAGALVAFFVLGLDRYFTLAEVKARQAQFAGLFATHPWSTAGGDHDPASLRGVNVTQTGLLVVSGVNLLQHIRTIHTNTTSYDGMLLNPLSGGIRYASAENATSKLSEGESRQWLIDEEQLAREQKGVSGLAMKAEDNLDDIE